MARCLLLALLSAALITSETAAQQPDPGQLAKGTCAVLDGLVQSAGNGFERYRGKAVASGIYDGAVWISGFQTCSVVLTDIYMYACTRRARSEEEARVLYNLAVERTQDCVPDWREVPPVDAKAEGLEMVQGLRIVEALDVGEIAIGVAHARDTRRGQPEDSVSLVVTLSKRASLAW
jgi:hypothetical protein